MLVCINIDNKKCIGLLGYKLLEYLDILSKSSSVKATRLAAQKFRNFPLRHCPEHNFVNNFLYII